MHVMHDDQHGTGVARIFRGSSAASRSAPTPAESRVALARRSSAPTCSWGSLLRSCPRSTPPGWPPGWPPAHPRPLEPDPEIRPELAGKYATVIATGRSDYPNQINNVLAAAHAIAELAADKLSPSYIVPSALDPRVAPAVAAAVISAVGS